MNPAELSIPADLDSKLSRLQMRAVIVSVIALILVIIGAVMNPPVFFRAWLMAWLLWLGVALGSLALQMLQFLSGGQWGVVSRRVFEAAGQTLPLLAILFIPILFGMGILYPWTHPDLVAGDAVLQHKHAYLNVPFFVIRAILYFVIWIGTAALVSRAGDHQDEPGARSRASAYSGLGLVLYFFTMTFAATDWAQSLQPHWYSTIWGFLFIVGQGLSAMSLGICAILLLAQWPPMLGIVRERHMHDLGKLLFMFVMLWAYLSFSQLLIIWAGNLPEEIPWYVERLATNWAGVSCRTSVVPVPLSVSAAVIEAAQEAYVAADVCRSSSFRHATGGRVLDDCARCATERDSSALASFRLPDRDWRGLDCFLDLAGAAQAIAARKRSAICGGNRSWLRSAAM